MPSDTPAPSEAAQPPSAEAMEAARRAFPDLGAGSWIMSAAARALDAFAAQERERCAAIAQAHYDAHKPSSLAFDTPEKLAIRATLGIVIVAIRSGRQP